MAGIACRAASATTCGRRKLKNGSAVTTSASIFCSASFSKAASTGWSGPPFWKMTRQSHFVRRRFQLHGVGVDARTVRIDQHADHPGARLDLQQQLQSLDVELRSQPGHACGVPARPVEARHQATFHRICDGGENDRDGVGGFFRGKCRDRTSGGNDHPDIIADQLGGERGKPVVAIVRCAIFDRDGLAFDIAGLGQPAAESCSPLLVQRSHRAAGEKTDNRKRLLLRAERQRRDQGGRKDERR